MLFMQIRTKYLSVTCIIKEHNVEKTPVLSLSKLSPPYRQGP